MIVGAYSLHLYCDKQEIADQQITDSLGHIYDEFPHEFVAETGGEARNQARKKGWKLNLQTNRALCPKCTKRDQTLTP